MSDHWCYSSTHSQKHFLNVELSITSSTTWPQPFFSYMHNNVNHTLSISNVLYLCVLLWPWHGLFNRITLLVLCCWCGWNWLLCWLVFVLCAWCCSCMSIIKVASYTVTHHLVAAKRTLVTCLGWEKEKCRCLCNCRGRGHKTKIITWSAIPFMHWTRVLYLFRRTHLYKYSQNIAHLACRPVSTPVWNTLASKYCLSYHVINVG